MERAGGDLICTVATSSVWHCVEAKVRADWGNVFGMGLEFELDIGDGMDKELLV